MARAELDRMLHKMPEVSPEQRQQMEELARRIVNKVLHDPISVLRNSKDKSADSHLYALDRLFQLQSENQAEKK